MDSGSREKQEKRRIEAYRERCMRDFPFFAATDLLIDQKGGGRPIPFVLNREQQYAWRLIEEQMNSTGMVRYNILKGRQQGMSTMVAALFFWRCVTQYGIRALIVSKDSKATHSVFAKIKRFAYERLVNHTIEVGSCNIDEITFPKTDSSIICQTARADNVGRGSSFSLVHMSECPYWERGEDQVAAIMDAVPRAPGTMMFMESTAKGRDALFYENYMLGKSGKSDWMSMFIPWHWNRDYRVTIKPGEDFEILPSEFAYMQQFDLSPEQMKWRRLKIYDYKRSDPTSEFNREYPADDVMAFETSTRSEFFDMSKVQEALGNDLFDCDQEPLVIGIDIGGTIDPSVACFRQGQNVLEFRTFKSEIQDEVVDWILGLIRNHKPRKVLIDHGPISMGIVQAVERKFKHIVRGIPFKSSPDDGDTYANKRAEMADRVRAFFHNNSVHLCPCDTLVSEMQIVAAVPEKEKLTLMDKAQIKRALGRSTDYLDALMLTFAEDTSLCGNHTFEEGEQCVFSIPRPEPLFME